MKIGFLVDKISYGGGELILNFLMKEMFSLGHSIYLYSSNKEWNENQFRDSFKIIKVPEIQVGIIGKLKGIYLFKKILKENKPDCLIMFSLNLSEFGVFAAILNNIPVILSERVDPSFFPTNKIHRFIKKVLFSISNGIVFQTEYARSYYSRVIQKKGIVIPNPVTLDNLKSYASLTTKKEIVAVGRLSEEKNFKMLINAFSKLNNNDYILKIFGDGPLKGDLLELIAKLDLGNKVFLVGHTNNVSEHITQADIFVLSSNHEGMPNALIESLALGLACISTDFKSGGARALIENRVNGLLIPVNNEEALISALNTLLDDPELKNNIKENALNIRNKYDRKIIIKCWIDFIKSKVDAS